MRLVAAIACAVTLCCSPTRAFGASRFRCAQNQHLRRNHVRRAVPTVWLAHGTFANWGTVVSE